MIINLKGKTAIVTGRRRESGTQSRKGWRKQERR